jgi:hypothetical protein
VNLAEIKRAPLASNLPGSEAPPEMIRLIHRSVRCFVLGLAGAVPVLGIFAAFQAIRLFQSITRETGEAVRWKDFYRLWVLGIGFATLLFPLESPAQSLALMIGFGLLQLLILRQAESARVARSWNPARRHLYWGMALAHFGIACTFWCLALYVKLETDWLNWFF